MPEHPQRGGGGSAQGSRKERREAEPKPHATWMRVSQSVRVYIYKPELRLGDLKNAKIFGACGGQKKRGGLRQKKKRPGELKTLPLH